MLAPAQLGQQVGTGYRRDYYLGYGDCPQYLRHHCRALAMCDGNADF